MIYDAFISYRHSELDKFVAETLHRQLEAFKLPKNLVNNPNLKKKKIERVFRDRDELPLASNLEDPIVEALKSSEYLIVICSPRLKESIWCQKEIQTFIDLHGRNKVFAVLVEGEPEDSFPEELLHDSEGNLVEPLAADVRGKNKAEVKKLIKEEMLRLLAPMFGVGFDDLRQRHKEQQMKKTAGIVSICGAVGVAFGLVCAMSAIRINAQKKIIEDQNATLANAQAESLSKDALELFEKDNRYDATELAYKAMTEYEGVKMPRSAYSERVLAECMSVYNGGNLIRAGAQIKTPGIVNDMKASPSGQYVLTSDNMGNLIAWDMNTRKSALEVKEEHSISTFDFIDDDRFYYATMAGGIKVATISNGSIKCDKNAEEQNFDIVWDVKLCDDGEMLAVLKVNEIEFLDVNTLEEVSVFEGEKDGRISEMYVSNNSDYVWATGMNADEKPICISVDTKSGLKKSEIGIQEDNVNCGIFGDKYLYLLSSKLVPEIVGGYSYVTAIDLQDGKVAFSTKIDDFLGAEIYYSNGEGQNNILVTSISQMYLLDGDAGKIRKQYFNDTNFAYHMLADDGDFLLYETDGDCRSIDVGDDLTDLTIPAIICADVLKFERAGGTLVGIRDNDDRLILYGYVHNQDAYEYTEESTKDAVSEGLSGESAIEWAAEKEIPDANFVSSCLELEDAGLYLVGYLDKTLRIYNNKTNELVCKYDDIPMAPTEYYGKVNDYLLVSNSFAGYLFDEEGRLRATIDDFMGLSNDGKAVVVSGRNMNTDKATMAIPVYDQKGLLAKAKEYLDKK